MYLGIDISALDSKAKVDWPKVKTTGCSYVFFRGTYKTWSDPSWKSQAQKAKDAGLTIGAYLFPVMSKQAPSPAAQVAAFVKTVGPLTEKEFPPVLDVEFSSQGIGPTGRSRPELLDWIREAVFELRLAYGVAPIIYTSARIWDGEDADSLDAAPTPDLVDCPLWLARYPYKTHVNAVWAKPVVDALPLPPVPVSWGKSNVWIHQYQGDAVNFPGIERSVDLNRFFDLRLGSQGERVKWAQAKLKVSVDGAFGIQTYNAVCRLQHDKGLKVDGIIGPKTFVALCWAM
jgi:lysozyme